MLVRLKFLAVVTNLSFLFVSTVAADLPGPKDLVAHTWCYATSGGRNVEAWSFDDDGRVAITTFKDAGNWVTRASRGATWRLSKNKLVLRAPPAGRRVLTITTREGTRLFFSDGTQAQVCRPR